jgi:hypothetical protein
MSWTFLTTHGRALIHLAHAPEVRLRDLAGLLGVTEKTAFTVVGDLCETEHVERIKDGRRNRYVVRADLPLPGMPPGETTLAALGAAPRMPQPEPEPAVLREALALVDARVRGDIAEAERITASTPHCGSLVTATSFVATTLAHSIALYGDVSAREALSLVALDPPPS